MASYEVGDYVYLRTEDPKSKGEGTKFLARHSGPYVVRELVEGFSHRYLIPRTKTSATFDAHATRLRRSPGPREIMHGEIALEKRAADGVGSGRRIGLMKGGQFEVDRIVSYTPATGNTRARYVVSFRGEGLLDRKFTSEAMTAMGLQGVVDD